MTRFLLAIRKKSHSIKPELDVLKNYFETQSHTFDIYYELDDIDTMRDNPINIDVNNYDVLLITTLSKITILKKFLMAEKEVIYVPLSYVLSQKMLQEVFIESVKIGIPGEFFYKNSQQDQVANIKSKFACPALCNFKITKTNALSHNDFFSKYSLNPSKKLVTLFLGRLEQLVLMESYLNNLIITRNRLDSLIDDRLARIATFLNNNNYEFVIRKHPRQDASVNSLREPTKSLIESRISFLNNYTVIDNTDGYEVFNYTDYAITLASSVVYELYAFEIPTLELGTGSYFFNWRVDPNKYTKKKLNADYISRYNNGKDLIYGTVTSKTEFDNIETTLQSFLITSWDINTFTHRDNHPLFGNYRNTSKENIYTCITNQVAS